MPIGEPPCSGYVASVLINVYWLLTDSVGVALTVHVKLVEADRWVTVSVKVTLTIVVVAVVGVPLINPVTRS